MVGKVFDFNNLSWQRRPFALSNDGKKNGLPFCFCVQSCIGKSYLTNFFVFFPVIFTGPRLLRSRNFATMATWRNDLSILDGILLKKCLVFKPGLCYRHRLRCCQSYCSSTLRARYAFLPLPFFWMNRKSQLLKKSQLRKNQVKCKNKCSVSFPKRWSWRALISKLKENS